MGQARGDPRLIALRQAALKELAGRRPLVSGIRLDLELHLPGHELLSAGDLDNFITGVCDGLMAATRGTPLSERWADPDVRDVHPSVTIAIADDSAIVHIEANKKAEPIAAPWYRLTIEGSELGAASSGCS